MGDNTNESFAGFGCHLINDLLATIPLHPATPAYDVCADTRTFERFKATMCTYMDQWNSPTFLNKICTRSNDSNPFAFAATTDTLYTSMFIFVFRKAVAKVSTTLYNKMTAQGLLDPRHTIGMLGHLLPNLLCDCQYQYYIQASPILPLMSTFFETPKASVCQCIT